MRTLYSGISAGTELATYRGTNPYLQKQWDPRLGLFLPGQATFSYPVDVWGYSEVGVVEALGPETDGVAVDDVVWGIWGHRSHAVLPADRLAGHQLPGGLDPIVGTFDRVGAVALNAVLATGACVGESVAVFGLGVIGLLATQLLIAQGNDVLAVDTMPHRLKLAEQFGAQAFPAQEGDLALLMREQTAGRGPDRVIELTGAYPALHQAIRVAGVGGTRGRRRVLPGTGHRLGPRRGVSPQPGDHRLLSDRVSSAGTQRPLDQGTTARDRDELVCRWTDRSAAPGQPRDPGP